MTNESNLPLLVAAANDTWQCVNGIACISIKLEEKLGWKWTLESVMDCWNFPFTYWGDMINRKYIFRNEMISNQNWCCSSYEMIVFVLSLVGVNSEMHWNASFSIACDQNASKLHRIVKHDDDTVQSWEYIFHIRYKRRNKINELSKHSVENTHWWWALVLGAIVPHS